MEFNSKIISLLEKIEKPISSVNVSVAVNGIFSIPDELRVTDENNQNFFNYKVFIADAEIGNGKIFPRQLTEAEIKEAEEKKKGGKKDKVVEDEGDMQRLPTDEEKRRKAEWDMLPEETKFHRTSEDPYKAASIKWKESKMTVEKAEESLVIFEERVYDDKGDWIYFTRTPTATEDELVKLRKSKPKNMTLGDLNPLVYRAWVDYSDFNIPGLKSIERRLVLEQEVEDGDTETPRPALNNMYLFFKITVDPPITPIVTTIRPSMAELLPKPPIIPKDPPSITCLNEFKGDLEIIMESLSIEYANMFGKDLMSNETRLKNTLTVQKKAEIEKRKEQFLYDFNITGKYKILKERLKKSIVKICRDKFQKSGSCSGVTTDQRDQFYSEIYVFLVEQMRETLSSLVRNKRDEMHEDIVVSHEQCKRERDQMLISLTSETETETYQKYATEYEILGKMVQSEKYLKKFLALDPTNPRNWFQYAKFCLKNKNFSKAEEAVSKALNYEPESRDYQILMACLYMRRSRNKEALFFLQEQLKLDLVSSLLNLLIAFVYMAFLKEERTGKKYQNVANRVYMRNMNMLPPKATHQESPNPFELPDFKQKIIDAEEAAKKIPVLSHHQLDDIWMEMLDYLAKNQLFDLVDKAMELLIDKTTTKALILRSQIDYYYGNYENSVATLNKLIGTSLFTNSELNPKSYEIYLMKANLCYQSDKFYEYEETFFKAMRLKATKNFAAYLRLGYIYLKRKSWGEAKSVFSKACEMKPNSPLSWLGLGISCIRTGDLDEAEEALNQANIYEPYNADVWGHLVLLCLSKSRIDHSKQCLRELYKLDIDDVELLDEIGQHYIDFNENLTAQEVLKQAAYLSEKKAYYKQGEIYLKLGKIYESDGKFNESLEQLEKAKIHLVSETQKASVKKLILSVKEKSRSNIK